MRRLVPFALLLTFLLALHPIPTRAQGQAPIRVLGQETENRYPDALTFRLTAEADAPITKVTLYYRLLGDASTTRATPTFTPGQRIVAVYTWDTASITIPPSAPVVFHWVIEDEQGNRLETEPQIVRYDDLRFPWQERADEQIIVRWYEGDAAFGETIYETARRALDQMQQQTGRTLEFPVYVLIYANDRDFASWHTYVDQWVGGQAFPSLGVTVEIIPPNSDPRWIQSVIPHEIAHLFFYQIIHANLADWPHWLDEGFAQFYEFTDPTPALQRAARAARTGRLIPLHALSGSFGRDPEQVRLAYDEALSAVVYIHETWGDQGFANLVTAFRQGRSTRQAFAEALGVTWEEFIAGWLTWMGVPATPEPSPTPTAGYVFPTAPVWNTPTPLPKTTPTLTATATAPPSTRPTATPTPTAATPSLPLRCTAPLGLMLFPLGLLFFRTSRARRRTHTSSPSPEQAP